MEHGRATDAMPFQNEMLIGFTRNWSSFESSTKYRPASRSNESILPILSFHFDPASLESPMTFTRVLAGKMRLQSCSEARPTLEMSA